MAATADLTTERQGVVATCLEEVRAIFGAADGARRALAR